MIDPHRDQPVLRAGATLEGAKAAMILLHGRGAGAEDILGLAGHLDREEIAYLAPEAAGWTWYPHPFMAPVATNEPWLSSALQLVDRLVGEVVAAGIPLARLVLLGFSQGACLASEYAARKGGRFGGIAVLSGGVIGPTVEEQRYSHQLAGTPVLFGCSDVDPHIPVDRVNASAELFRARGAEVTERIYRGMGHSVNEDELVWVRGAVDKLLGLADQA